MGRRLEAERIVLVFLRFHHIHGDFPRPIHGMHQAIKEAIEAEDILTADLDEIDEFDPLLAEEARQLVERYFPHSFE